jgi:hypothetical protein
MGKPSAPNPQETANLQSTENTQSAIATAQLGMVNQSNPYGSLNYQQTGTNADGIPQYSSTQTLSAPEQSLFNQSTANSLQAGGIAGGILGSAASQLSGGFNPTLNPLSYSAGAPSSAGPASTYGGANAGQAAQAATANAGSAAQSQLGNYAGSVGNGGENVQTSLGGPNIGQMAQQSENAAYANQMGYLATPQAEQQSDLTSQLAAQGITQGSAAYNRAETDLSQNQTFAQQQAESSAVNQGLTTENQLYNQNLNTGAFNNSAQQQQYSQAMGNANLQDTAAAGQTQNNQFNAGAQNNMSQFNAGLAQQANLANAQSQNNMSQYNAGLNEQTGLSDMAAQNNMSQYNTGLQQSGNQFNATMNNNAEGQNLGQQISVANQPLSEYSSLMSGAQPTSGAYASANGPQVAATNISGLIGQNYTNQLGSYNNALSGAGGLGMASLMSPTGTFSGLSGLFGGSAAAGGAAADTAGLIGSAADTVGSGGSLLAAMGLLSDIRAKENIQKVGVTDGGHNVYTYNYKGNPTRHMGVIAQEMLKKNPEAVHMLDNGLYVVDYSKVN